MKFTDLGDKGPDFIKEMDSQGYRGSRDSRDSIEDDAGKKEYYGKVAKPDDVVKQGAKALDNAFNHKEDDWSKDFESRMKNEAKEDAFMSKLGGLKTWQVVIMNNYYRGKYSDYSGRYYYVVASSPEEAKQVVLDNADGILQDLLSMKSHNGKKILPRSSAVRITPDRIGKVEDGTVAGRMSTAGYKKMFGPQGPMMVKLSGGDIVDVQGQEQGVAEGSPTVWEVSFDYGPHMSDTVKVKAGSEDEAIAKVEKAAEKRGRSIDINWAKPAEQGVAEGGYPDVDHMPGPTIKRTQTGCKRCHGKGYVYKTPDGETHPMNRPDAKKYKCGKCDGIGFVKVTEQGVAEGLNDTVYPNAEVIKSKNGKPVGEIYQDGNSWGAFHYRADRGYDMIDSREDAIEALKDLHQETGRSRPDYTIKGVAEGQLNEYLVRAGMPVRDVLALNLFQDFDPVEGAAAQFPEFAQEPMWKQVVRKYAPIAKMLEKQLLATNRRLTDSEAEAVDEIWYDGSDAYDDMEIEYLVDIYNQQIAVVEAIIAGDLQDNDIEEARAANSAGTRAGLAKRKSSVPLTPEEQKAKDAAAFEKWKAKNQKPASSVEEASLASMRDYFDQSDNTISVDNEYGVPERKKPTTHIPVQIQTLINKMYHVGKITPVEFDTLKRFQAKTGINVGLKIKEAGANPYAIGMSQAMKSTGDKPPLKKSTINKAHEIARAIKKGE